ncbi:MAG: 1-acyl-sn-glycerol-3-phosphate acyltransferase [Myxococcota bacterium]
MTVAGHLTSAVSLLFIAANLAFWLLLAIPTSVLRDLVPGCAPRARRWLEGFYRGAVRVDDFWLERVLGHRFAMPAALPLDPGRTWIVLANHVSWSDIFLLQSLLVRHGLVVQFLSKRELLLVPIVGLVLWAFQFPLLRRATRRGESDEERKRGDFEALRAACRRAREDPVALVCFAEGTRATPERRAERASPHRHLLPPRIGGFAALCDGLGDALAGVVDCTLVYASTAPAVPTPADPATPADSAASAPPTASASRTGSAPRPANGISFWAFLSGGVGGGRREHGASGAGGAGPGGIEVVAELVPAAEIPREREARARWLEARWARKDETIAARLAAHVAARSGAPR